MRKLHILFGDSPNGALQIALEKIGVSEESDTLAFYDDLSVGPMIFCNGWETGLKAREVYWEKVYHTENDDYLTEMKHFLNYPFDDYDDITIWHTDNASDWMMVYLLTARLSELGVDVPLFHMFEAMSPKLPRYGHEPGRFGLGILHPNELVTRYDKIERVKSSDVRHWSNEWLRLSTSDALVRVAIESGIVCEQTEDFYDEMLLSHCKKEFQKCAWVVGHTVVNSKTRIGDLVLAYRVRELVAQGKLISDNDNMSEIRFYSVKLP